MSGRQWAASSCLSRHRTLLPALTDSSGDRHCRGRGWRLQGCCLPRTGLVPGCRHASAFQGWHAGWRSAQCRCCNGRYQQTTPNRLPNRCGSCHHRPQRPCCPSGAPSSDSRAWCRSLHRRVLGLPSLVCRGIALTLLFLVLKGQHRTANQWLAELVAKV